MGGLFGLAGRTKRELLAYQCGPLLLPVVTSVAPWLALHRAYLAELVPPPARRSPLRADAPYVRAHRLE